jgi:hypothetical protein
MVVRAPALLALALSAGAVGCGFGRRIILYNDTAAPVVVPEAGRDGGDLYIPPLTRARVPVPARGEPLVVRVTNHPRRYQLAPLPDAYRRSRFPYGSEEYLQIDRDLRVFAVPAGRTFPARPPGPQPPGYPLKPSRR